MSDERASETDSAATAPSPEAWLRDVLMATERLPPAELAAYQRRSLEIMLRHAFEQCPFYRSRLAPLFNAGGELRLDRWNEVPILDRTQVQQSASDILARETPKEAGKTHIGTTTGSTGIPLELHLSNIMASVAGALESRKLRWHNVDFNGRLAEIRTRKEDDARYPDGRRSPRWNRWGSGDCVTLSVRTSTIEQQLDWLARMEPTYLRTYPSVARAVLEEADRRGIKLPIAGLFTVGETVPDELRQGRPAHWPVTIDTYATTESGPLCGECPRGSYHVHVENVLMEILDENDLPVSPGCAGRVVFTSLYNFAMPFIRYAVGDYVEAGDGACSCGLTLPTVKRVVGRQRNLFRFGERTIWPSTRSTIMREFVPYRYRQIAQVAPFTVEFRYAPVAEDQTEDPERLQAYLKEVLDSRIQVSLKRVPLPDRSRGQKIEDYTCEI